MPQPSTPAPDPQSAFVPHAPLGVYGEPDRGPLSGLDLAVKDLFDVAGLVTGAGTPAWARGRAPADTDAAAVARLRAAGARIVGKTVTDELAWSLAGENIHYGSPPNPAAPGRVAGGSSSGSASAVASGLAHIGLGTDTGGSIRLPASHTGLWGIRTTHGRVPLAGVVPLAPSYDTVGWVTRDPDKLARVAGAILGSETTARPGRLLLARDLFERVAAPHGAALLLAAEALAERLGLAHSAVVLAPDGLETWRETFRICQSSEAWHTHGRWVTEARPDLGPDIAARFADAARLDRAEIAAARRHRREIAERLEDLLAGDAILILPGAASPPPLRGRGGAELAAGRMRALEVLCPASHAGMPQVALPALHTPEGPLGLGLMGPRGTDMALIAAAGSAAAPAPGG